MLKQQGTRKTRGIRKKQTKLQGNFLGLGHFLRLKDSISLHRHCRRRRAICSQNNLVFSIVIRSYLSVNWLIAHLSWVIEVRLDSQLRDKRCILFIHSSHVRGETGSVISPASHSGVWRKPHTIRYKAFPYFPFNGLRRPTKSQNFLWRTWKDREELIIITVKFPK